MEKATFGYRLHFETEASREAGRQDRGACPPGLNRVFFVSGGSEAVESAIKLARQYALATGSRDVGRSSPRALLSRFHPGRAGVTGYAPLTAPFAR